MIKRIAFLFFGLLAFFNAAQAQRLVKLNLLEKSPLANMVVYSMNDSTANYTKLVAGTGIQITYNENDTTLTITATGTSVGVPQTLSLDDATRVLSISDGNSVDLSESIQEEINAMLVAGDNVTLTYDDVSNTLTIASTGGGGGATNIGDLGDVTITSATNGQVLKYDGAAWINGVDLNTETLSALTDVDTTGKTDGSIVLYNSTSGNWEAQANSIDNLIDARRDTNFNLIAGFDSLSLTSGNSNTGYGYNSLIKVTSGLGNTAIGRNALALNETGNYNTAIGRIAFASTKSSENTGVGAFVGTFNKTGIRNTYMGYEVNTLDTIGSNNTLIGTFVGSHFNFIPEEQGKVNFDSVTVLGSNANTSLPISTNEIVLGAFARGNGSNTATLGNNNITATYLKGTTNLRGYGLGNKEAADLSKTGSGYFLEVATDGTLIESTITGGTAQTLSFNDATRELSISSGNTVDLTEGIQDEIAATVTAGEGITLTYDDALGTLTVAAPAGAGNTDEQTLSINNSTAELSISNGNTVDLSEAIDNQVNSLFVDGTNILSTYDDISNTLTVRTTDALTQIDAITFDNNVTDAVTSRLQYNADVGTFVAGMANNVPVKIGQDIGWYVKNNTASTIPKGTAVMAVGADGNSGIMLIDEMVFDGTADAKYFLGVTAEAITSGSNGFIISQGVLKGYDTSLISPGSVLYGDPTTPGGFVTTEPTGTNLKLPIANTLSQTNNGTIAIRVHTGLYMKDIHDVDITGVTNNSILKYNSSGGYWDIATDLVDDADADPTNEIQDLSLSSNTLSLSGDATTVDLSPYLDEATTASNGLTLSGTDVKLGGTLSDATTTIDMNSNALTFTNNGGYNLSGTGGLSFTNTSATDYSSVLSIAPTNTRIYADGGTTEPLNSLNLTSARSGIKELDLRSSVSNDNTTYTMIALNPTRFSMKTPNVTDLTATNGQFLKLVDRLTGEVEFDDIIDLTSLSVTTNSAGTAALSYNNTNGVFTYTPPDLSSYLTAEVDGSVTNEIQTITASNGLTATATGDDYDVKLGGALTATTTINGSSFSYGLGLVNFSYLNLDASQMSITSPDLNLYSNDFKLQHSNNATKYIEFLDGTLELGDYGLGNKTESALGFPGSPTYYAAFNSDGTLMEIPISSISGESTTASNGLTLSGTNVKLGGTLTEITNIAMGGFNASIFDATSSTGLAIQPSINEVIMYGTQSFTDYGSGNKEAADLSKTFSGHYAGFATDGTVIEVNALPITTGTSATIDWGNMPQRIHVLDFGANTSLTLAFSNVLTGGIYTLRVTGNAGTDTLVWPAAAKFEDGTSVGTITLQDGGQMFTFYWDGTNYWVK